MARRRTLARAGVTVAALLSPATLAQSFSDLEGRLRDHPALEAMHHSAHADRDRAVAAYALPDPVFSFGVGNFPLFAPSFDRYLPTNKSVGVRQTFPARAKREAAAREARHRARETEAMREARYAGLRAELISLLVHKRRIARQRALAGEQSALYDELARVVEAEIDAGRPAVFRLAEIEAERVGVARLLVGLDGEEGGIDARLVDLVGDVPTTGPPPVESVAWTGDFGVFHAVRVAAATISVAAARVAAAEASWQPEWGLQLTYQQREDGRGGTGSTFAGDDWVSGMVTFTVPLWAERSQEPRFRAAAAERNAARSEYLAVARNALAQYRSHAAVRRAANAAVEVIERKIAAVEDEVASRLTTYESGAGDYSPIVDGEIAILALRAEIAGEEAAAAAAAARMNGLLAAP